MYNVLKRDGKIVDFGNEVAIYNDSNTTQREITAFEIIDNAMDELKANGEMEEIIERVKQTRINSMTERAIKDNLKLYQSCIPCLEGNFVLEYRLRPNVPYLLHDIPKYHVLDRLSILYF